jgi:hypothetical protein
MPESATIHRRRDKNGEISRKHGNTLIRTPTQNLRREFREGLRRQRNSHRRAAQAR